MKIPKTVIEFMLKNGGFVIGKIPKKVVSLGYFAKTGDKNLSYTRTNKGCAVKEALLVLKDHDVF